MLRSIWMAGAVLAMLAVAAGAFGAHALRARVDAGLLVTFETAARYQMYHALALLALAAMWPRLEPGWAGWSAWLWVGGVVVFSGSLYVLVLSGVRWLGAITPFGGVLLLAGWVAAAMAAWRA